MKKGYVDFAAVKAQAGMRQILERYGILEGMAEQGDRISGRCPICEGDGPTQFRVSQAKNCFKCFRCDAGGNVLDFVAAMERCSVRDAAATIAEWYGIGSAQPVAQRKPAGPKPQQRVAEAADPPVAASTQKAEVPQAVQPTENPPLTFELKTDPDHPWFAANSVLPDTVREFGLGYCSKGMMAGRIAFPLRNAKGETVGYAGLWAGGGDANPPEAWKYPKGLSLDLVAFPIHRLTIGGASEIRIVHDPFEVVMLWQLGVTNAVSLPGAVTRRTLDLLAAAIVPSP